MNQIQQTIKTDVQTLTTILKSCYAVVENPTIQLDPEGLIFRSMDRSHVALIDIRIENSNFQQWSITKEIKFSFDVKTLLKIVSSLNKKLSVNLEILPEEIKIGNSEGTTNFKISEGGANDCPIPKIPYDSKIESSAGNFKTVLKGISALSDYVTLETSVNNCLISGKGDQGSTSSQLYQKNGFSSESRNDSLSTYSLEYITPFLKAMQKDQKLIIEYSTIKPCRISAKIGISGSIHFYLAPRVEN